MMRFPGQRFPGDLPDGFANEDDTLEFDGSGRCEACGNQTELESFDVDRGQGYSDNYSLTICTYCKTWTVFP